MEVGEFAARYRAALDDLGHPADATHGLTGPFPDWLPRSLEDLYRVAGNHPLNSTHNRLIPPDELMTHDRRVVFAEENQQVVVWAFDADGPDDDPLVWQGQPDSDDPESLTWYSEEQPLSDFIIDMWGWVTGGG